MSGAGNGTRSARDSSRALSKTNITNILQVKIPAEIAEIEKLLASPVCTTSPARPLGSTVQQNSFAENLARAGFSVMTTPSNNERLRASSNEAVVSLINGLEEQLSKMRKHAIDLDHWLTMSAPMVESGYDIGVETRKVALRWLRRLRDDCDVRLQNVTDYHSTRAAILSSFMTRPGFYDLLLAVERFDMAQLELFKMYALKIKNTYEEMLHFCRLNLNYFYLDGLGASVR